MQRFCQNGPWGPRAVQDGSKTALNSQMMAARLQDDGNFASRSRQDANLKPIWANLGSTWAKLGPSWPNLATFWMLRPLQNLVCPMVFEDF